MKLNKNIFISVLLLLIMLCIIGTASATDSLDNNLTAADDAVSVDAGDVSLASTDDELLGDGETTIYVDSSYAGDQELGTEDNPYKSISTAVSNANGGETIFIKNGEYNESCLNGLAKPLSFIGESPNGVIIRTAGTSGFVYTTAAYSSLVFENLVFKDVACSGSYAVMFIGNSGNVNITNCVFDNTSGRYGALRIFTSGSVVIDKCKFLNTKSTTGSYSSAIDFGGSGTNNYIISNTLIDNSARESSTYIFGVIYSEKTAGTVILDNVTITNCNITNAHSIIYIKGNMEIKNSKFANNSIYRDNNVAGLFGINGGKSFSIETSIIADNREPNFIISANSDSASYNLAYNNIQNNTFVKNFTNPTYDIYTLDYNYWGNNDGPTDLNVAVNNWAIDDNGEFKLNDGSPLAKEIPRLGEAPIGDENSTWVSVDGDNNNTGSRDSPVATIAKAVELAKNRTGEIFIEEGTYTENGIDITNDIGLSITGIGNVVIDGNASSNSIFILHGGAATVTNIRFTNNKPSYGGAIFINYGTGTSTNIIDIDVTVDGCTFENLESLKRGGSIYAHYTRGNLIVKDSHFINSSADTWGGAICVSYSSRDGGLNVEISDCTFEDCSANNGGAGYLTANTLTITNSEFNNNSAVADSGAMYIYNTTASIDNCIITNNKAGSQAAAIKESIANKIVKVLTITNSVIENNTGVSSTLPAIYVDQNTLEVSYSSLVNDLSVETRTATGYDAVYGQGIATVNNNWWGTNDPSTKVTGTNITMDNWVIMNVEANVTEAIVGDSVKLTVDFNHVNTTSGEIEELTGGTITKTHKVRLSSNDGTIVPATLTIKDGATKSAVYTVGDINDVVSVSSEEALVKMSFVPEVPPYYGIIYVSKDGDDNNKGSEDAPVATIEKAIELASIVGGSGQIIINEGTYNGTEYLIAKDLTITGVGNVVLDAEGKGRFFNLPSTNSFDKFELNNVALINSAANPEITGGYYGTILYNYAASEVVFNNVTIRDNDGNAATLISTNGYNLVFNNSVISDNVADKLIAISGKYDNLDKSVTIVNTTFENNIASNYRIIEAGTSSGSLTLNLTDSHFISNTGKLGIVQGDSKTTINVVGTEFISNTNNVSSGGAIDAYTLNVINSLFMDNKAARSGGAIYITGTGDAVITKSTFINNTAGEEGSAIYNGNKLAIDYSVLLTDSVGYVIYHDGGENVMEANYNWWGTNDDPSSLIGVDTYEDDWGDYVDCEFDASKWVVMNVVNNLTSTDPLNINDTIEFTVDFNHYTDSTGTIYELSDSIPEVEVSANAIKGFFDEDAVTTENNVATLVYTADIGGEEEINITSANAVNTTLINITEPVILEVVYVSPNGNDSNPGYYDEPVATIAHAIEIAERGKIVLFEGIYTISGTLGIDKDMDIRGEGTVIIDGDLTRILENTANLNLTNLIFTNGKLGFAAAILNDGNMTIEGCTFYNNTATASTSGNIINNRKGTMTINNSIFYENVASRGAVASQSGTNLIVNNSEFYNNDMSLSGSNSYYGIVYSTSADTIVENTVFRNNKAKQGAGIWATRSTSATTGSLEVINCTFENNIAEIGTGGAIFASGKVIVDVYDSTFINNTATKSQSGVGGNGGAIYSTGTSDVTVIDSVFIDNAGSEDAGIYAAGNTFDISNSVILAKEGDANYALNGAGATVTANDNFWGDNSKANTNANVAKWVIMSATYDNETGALDITFDKTNSTAGVADYDDVLPDGFTVTVTSSSGALDETLDVIDGQASTTYFTRVSENITAKSGNAEVTIEVIVIPKVIYVARDGDDNNTGCSREDPVATIAKAIELADEGRIVILSGTYITGDLGIISDDLNITGEGTVTIDAQNTNRILYVGENANVVLTNLIMINGAADVDSGALLGNSNYLTLINCTLANSSAGINNGGAIYNSGKLTIINSTIANNTARVGGAIFNQYSGTELVIINSTFENNVANGDNNNGGGAIFAQQISGLTIINSSFIENEALTTSSGGAIGIIYAEADFTIDGSIFMDNHANGKESTGGGAIYIAGTSNYQRSGSLTITNTLFEGNTADNDGAAIYARATTLDVSNSVIFANKDPAGYAVFGYKTDQVAPAITLNDNWWGANDDPNDFVGGYNYDPTVSRWVILTATNDTPIAEGNTVKITVSLDKYTDGETIGDLAIPITIPREVFILTSFDGIEGVLENGEFTTDYVVPAGLEYLSASVDIEEIILLKVKKETVVTAEAIIGDNGDVVAINVTVNTVDGYVLGEIPVTMSLDGANSTYTTDEYSNVVIPISGLAPGNYTAFIAFEEDDDYLGSNATVDVVINKINTTVVAEAIVDDKGDVVAINVTVTTADGDAIGVVPVDVAIDDGNAETYNTDENGNVVVPISGLTPGSYVATVTYAGDNDTYVGSSASVDVVINKIITILYVEDITVERGETATINVIVNAMDDSLVNTGEVSVYLDDDGATELIAIIPVVNGTASQDFVFDYDAGVYGIIAGYSDDSGVYDISMGDGALNITKKAASLNITDIALDEFNMATITAEITEGIEGTVTFVVIGDDASYTEDVAIVDGIATYTTPALDAGSYVVLVSFEGNDYYYDADANDSIAVDKINTTLTVPEIAIYNSDNSVVATLNDIYGNPISGVNVKVTVGTLAKTLKTDANGQVALNVSSLEPGRYTVTAKSASSGVYNWAPHVSAIAYIGEGKVNTTLTIPEAAISNENNTQVVATLKDIYGYALEGINVKVTVGSLAKTMKTDANGQVALDISSLEEGAYKVTAKSASTAIYNWAPHVNGIAYVGDAKVDTVLEVPNVATIVGSGTVVATLKDAYGNAIKGLNVKVTVGSLAKTMKTDANGQVALDISSLEAGNYTVSVKAASSSIYNWAPHVTATALVCEEKIDTVLTADDVVTTQGSGDKLVATLKDAVGNAIKGLNVKITVGSLAKTLKTDANGQVALDVSTLAPGDYTATIKSASSSIYNNAAQIRANVTVNES